jgi:hypothetical protein
VQSSEVLKLPDGSTPTLVLSGASNLRSGQFITTTPGIHAPEGFLLKVINSEISGGETFVDVRPASLYEAVPSGSLSVRPETSTRLPLSTNRVTPTRCITFWLASRWPQVLAAAPGTCSLPSGN